MMLTKEIKKDIKITEVANKCLRLIGNTTQIVTYTYQAIEKIDSYNFIPLRVDGLPIAFYDPENKDFNDLSKDSVLDWLFKKAFEEFIVGIIESLIEAYIFVKLDTFSKSTKTESYTLNQISEKIASINTQSLKLRFPELIEGIESELKSSLFLKDEILSINQVRNCLVHRNSFVSTKDINDLSNQSLKLSFVELVVISEKDGKIIEVKLEDKKEGFLTKKIDLQSRNRSISFKKGELVKIDPTTFNNISFTCYQFVNKLLESIPEPD
jgi:hypothetical protein